METRHCVHSTRKMSVLCGPIPGGKAEKERFKPENRFDRKIDQREDLCSIGAMAVEDRRWRDKHPVHSSGWATRLRCDASSRGRSGPKLDHEIKISVPILRDMWSSKSLS